MDDLMKLAFLLTLYDNPEQANLFIKQLLKYPYSYIFIHIDAKALAIRDSILMDERVNIMPESVWVKWGDFSQIKSVLALMQYAKSKGDFAYYSLHSGNDLLVRPIEELVEYLRNDNDYAYIDCCKLPAKHWQYGGGLGRIALYWPAVFRKKYTGKSLMRYIRSIYGRLYGAGVLRGRALPKGMDFYGGSDWFTLSGDCVRDILKYTEEHEDFLRLFKASLIGSEIYFATIIQQNAQAGKNSNNNLRYIDWGNIDSNAPGSPGILRLKDYDAIKQSGCFFARKFDIRIDKDIVNKLL